MRKLPGVNYERKMQKVQVSTFTNDDLEGSIASVIETLQNYQKQYPDSFLSYEDITPPYSDTTTYGYVLYAQVLETDVEMNSRIDLEERRVRRTEEIERAQLAELLKKYTASN